MMIYHSNISKYVFGMTLLEYTKSTIKLVNLCEQNAFIPDNIKCRMKEILITLIDIVTIFTNILKNSRTQ